jgi:outer membrane protein
MMKNNLCNLQWVLLSNMLLTLEQNMAVMKKLAIMLTSTMLMGSVALANAAPAAAVTPTAAAEPNLTIGVIDLAAVLQQSSQAKAAGEQLKSQFQPRQKKIMAAQQQLQGDQDKLKRDGSVMSAADAQALQTKINAEGRDLQQMQEDYMQDLRAAQSQAMQKVLGQIDQIVQKIAAQGHYDLIVQKNSVAFSSPRVDITNQVIQEMKNS